MPPSIPRPCLCLVTGPVGGERRSLLERIDEAVAGGVDMVQLRDKVLPAGELLELAVAIKETINGRALFMVNERADVAAAAGADGVQLGERAMPLAAARRVVGPECLIGRSVHSPEGAAAAQVEGADFLIVGAMFPTASHPGVAAAGPRLLEDISRLLERNGGSVPLMGIGGITESNAGEVMRAGAAGVAVITSILGASDSGQAAAGLKRALLNAWEAAAPVPDREPKGGRVGA